MDKKIKKDLKNYKHANLDIKNYKALSKSLKKIKKILIIIRTAAQPSHDWAKNKPFVDLRNQRVWYVKSARTY